MPVDSAAVEMFVRSVALGIAVAAPVGPMALLCIGRTLRFGARNGILFGSGVAAADACYAALAAAGVSAVGVALVGAAPWIQGIGAVLLLWLGRRTMRAPVATTAAPDPPAGRLRAFATAFGLTLANPPTILFFAGIFASLGGLPGDPAAALFPIGVLAGSLAWWVVLVAAVSHGRTRLTPAVMIWINRLSGAALIAFAATSVVDLLVS